MRISDGSSDVCSSDRGEGRGGDGFPARRHKSKQPSLVFEIPAAEPKPIPSQTLPLKGRASKARGTDAMNTTMQTAAQLNLDWSNNTRWNGVTRSYCAADVVRLRGTVHVEHSLAKLGAEKLWKSLHGEPFVNALGALTGNQAMQQVKAGLKAIYLSGWQVAADANLAGQMYPDQSLYPADSVPAVVKRINNTLLRADQLQHAERSGAEGKGDGIDYLQPIVAENGRASWRDRVCKYV